MISVKLQDDQTDQVAIKTICGVQPRMISVDIFFEFLRLLFFALLLLFVT